MREKKYITTSSHGTEKLGEDLAKTLKGGEVLALYGDLGSGKTTFIKGLAKGLGIKSRITSPTFIIQNIHFSKNKLNLYHYDLYRLDNVDKSMTESLRESFSDPKGVSVIEWAQRFNKFPKKTIILSFEYLDNKRRSIVING